MTSTVHRRHVFYVPGFDPFPPRRYREMYRRESALQAEISGFSIDLRKKRPGGSRYGWSVEACIDGVDVETEIEILYWADIVRAHIDQGIWASYRKIPAMMWGYLSTGAVPRMIRLRPAPVFLAFMYPIAMLIGQLALALIAAALIGAVLGLALTPWLAPLGLAVVPPILRHFKKIDRKYYAYFLLHDYAFPVSTMGAFPPELEARIAEFKATVRAAIHGDADEVLIVGHSSGAQMAVSILNDVMREGVPPEGERPAIGLLTLGQVVPMSSFLPKAQRLRRDLNQLCQRADITWIDISAPADPACFALCDPVAVSGVAPEKGKLWPLVVTAAYSRALQPETWNKLRRRVYDCHLQYLRAFDRPRRYDYFTVTAGPMTLKARAERDWRASPSMDARPINRFRDMAP